MAASVFYRSISNFNFWILSFFLSQEPLRDLISPEIKSHCATSVEKNIPVDYHHNQ